MPLVSIAVFLPLLGAASLVVLRGVSARTAHLLGLVVSGLTLLASLVVGLRGISSGSTFSQIEQIDWIPSLGSAYRVGVDGISLPLVPLTAILFFVSLVFSLRVRERVAAYVAFFLLLETTCLGAFVALDLVLFYVFFELTLVAMYFIIAGWGHAGGPRAALLFFLYTLAGSLPILLGFVALYLGSSPRTFDLRQMVTNPPLAEGAATLTFVAFMIGFGIKTPIFPFHTWLPAAHVEAPTAGSVVLAGVLLKLGTYGFVRFALQTTPDAFRLAAPWVAALAVLSALYGAFVALAQTDLKRMVAYTSVNHMGYVILAIAAAAAATDHGLRAFAIDGAVLQMVSHGVVTGALFLIVGALQERAGTREMGELGGLLRSTPLLSWAFILAALASLGLPGLAHFPAEFQIFLSTFGVWPLAAGIAVLGILFTAGLYLRAIQSTFLGAPGKRWRALPDLGGSDLWAVVPLLVLAVVLGILPGIVLDIVHRTASLLGS